MLMTDKNKKKNNNDLMIVSISVLSQPPGIGGLVKIGSVLEANALKYFNFEGKKIKYFNFVRQQEGHG